MTSSTPVVLRLGGACLAAFFIWSSAAAQTTVAFTGGDAGDGLALTPGNVVQAYNINGGSVTWQGVAFTGLTLGVQDPTFDQTSADPFAGQASSDDNALRSILQTLAWDDGGGSPINYTFAGLTAGATYQLTVLYFSGEFAEREQAFLANNTLITLATVSQTTASYTSFEATANGSGEISFRAVQSGDYGGTGNQDGAIINAIVLSNVSAVPEPATWAAIAGAAALAVVLVRRRWHQRAA
ncbi:MAG: PEP-CTERM sorting domain-containing protein [Candidatus Didemnitutus sp.]|nr:PEP-CTERM sorting domain-containing protein [Candidatus Didemnitutus sp.]